MSLLLVIGKIFMSEHWKEVLRGRVTNKLFERKKSNKLK